MAFGIDNQRWNVQRQPEAPTNRLAVEASVLAANHPLRQVDSAVGQLTPRLDVAPSRPVHADSNYVLRNKDGEVTHLDFGAGNLYASTFSDSLLSRNARDQADQVINRV